MSIVLRCSNSECGELLELDSAHGSPAARCPQCDAPFLSSPATVEGQATHPTVAPTIGVPAEDSRDKATIAPSRADEDVTSIGNAPSYPDIEETCALETGMTPEEMSAANRQSDDFSSLSQYLHAKRKGNQESFFVEKTLAKGGMGEVLVGRDEALQRQVAVKVIKAPYASSVEHRSRFLEEAQITGQLEHPNIVPIHDLSLDANGDLYFSMKLVRGESLSEILKEMRSGEESVRSLTRLLNIFLKVCDAIAFAHSRGVVHRDLKPANIMVGDFGEVLVMDWGLAKSIGTSLAPSVETTPADDEEASATAFIESDSLRESVRATARTEETEAGTVQGTPAYMSPEQARGETDLVDQRADIYSLGAILYEVLTLERPVEGKGVVAIIKNVQQGNIIPPEERMPQRGIPKELSAVVMQALQTRREDRYQSVTELARDVTLFLEGRAVSAKADSAVESFVKLVRRNKALSAAIAIAASIILVLATVSYVRITDERDRAMKGERAAKENESRAIAGEKQAEKNALKAQQNEQKATAAQQQQWETALAASKRFAMQAVEQAELHQLEPAKRRAAEAKLVAPDGPWGLFAQAAIAKARVDYPLAAKLFQQAAASRDGDQPEIRAELAEVLALQGNVQDAEALLANLDEIEDWRIVLSAGRALYAAYKWDACRQPLARAIALMNREKDRPQETVIEAEQLIDAAPAQKACDGFYQEIRHLPLPQMRAKIRDKMAEIHGRRIGFGLEGDLKQGLFLSGHDKSLKHLYPFRNLPIVEARLNNGPACAVWDLSPIAGMPLTLLSCRNCNKLRYIDPLANMATLETLSISRTAVDDLSPLAGLKLRRLHCYEARGVNDLTPLASMPLELLDLRQANVADLTPLAGMPLTELRLQGNELIRDLSPLRGMQLEKISTGNNVRDLSPLAGMPLTYFTKSGDVNSLAPLRGMRLEVFKLTHAGPWGGYLDDDFFAPLEGMPLKQVDLSGTRVHDLSPFRRAPLEHLDIRLCAHIKSLEPLRGSPLSTLYLWDALHKDLSPLADLKKLDERKCPWVPYLLGKTTEEELESELHRLRQRGPLPLTPNNSVEHIPEFVQRFRLFKLYGQGKLKEALDVAKAYDKQWGLPHGGWWLRRIERELAEQQQSDSDG